MRDLVVSSSDTCLAGGRYNTREFAIPFNGDQSLLTQIEELGLAGSVREFYGTDGRFVSGRRTKCVGAAFGAFVRNLRDSEIEFNYLLNAINCDDYLLREADITDNLKRLEDNGVTVLTVSHPLLLDRIKKKDFSFRINSSVRPRAWKGQAMRDSHSMRTGCATSTLSSEPMRASGLKLRCW